MKPLIATLLFCASAVAADTTVAKLYDGQIAGVEKEIVSLAEAMPADKFNFAPTTGAFQGVRTFAQQIKHVAAVNYIVSAVALGEKPPVETGGENGPDSIATKEQIVKYLKDSYTYAHKAALALTSANEVELLKSPFGGSPLARGYCIAEVIAHTMDHYGQIVVYARMNGIVPPASR